MGDETTVSSPYVFRGIEYIVTMSVKDGTALTVEVEDKLTADQWRAEFDSAYIEDLTHKTGNFKQFTIFVSMLESGIIQASESVTLDLLTYADLESLRQRKAGSAAKQTALPQRTVSLNSKRYLILTYTVEFDRIHYPLPLPYVGKPDPRLLQEQLRVVRAEMKTIKQSGNENKGKDLEKLRREIAALTKEKDDIENEFLQYRREMKTTTQGNALKELKMFKSMARQLEEELMKEKTKHQRQVSKHGKQYRDLLEELEEVRASERNLRARVKSLTNELALYKRDKVKTTRPSRSYSRSRENSFERPSSRASSRERSLSRDRERSTSRDISWSDRLSVPRDRSRDRDRTTNRSRLSDKSSSYKNNYSHRSRTPSPAPAGSNSSRFDPSAYIKEKERKRKETAMKKQRQQRANISGNSNNSKRPSSTARLVTSRLSDSSRNRSRNSSYNGEMSDGGMSDSSYSSLRNYSKTRNSRTSRPRSRSRQNNRSGLSAYMSSPDIPKKTESKTKRNTKILASTPESEYGRTRSVRNKENIPTSNGTDDSDFFDRSAEVSEIDERLNRLQQLMKSSMS